MIDNIFVYDIERQRQWYVNKEWNDIVIHYERYAYDNYNRYKTWSFHIWLSKEEVVRLIDVLKNAIE